MRKVYLFLIFFSYLSVAQAQDPNNEYYVPTKSRKIYPWIKNPQLDVIPLKYYLSVEGGYRKDYTTLSNTLSNIIANNNADSNPWGVLIGAMYNNKWMFETGYYRTNIEAGTDVNIRGVPGFRWQTKYTTLPLRVKRKLLSIGKIEKESGFYWEAGAQVLMPAQAERLGSYKFSALYSTGQGMPFDTLILYHQTFVRGGMKVLLETGLDLNVKLLPRWDVGFYCRGTFGFADIIYGEASFSGKPINRASSA